MTHLTPEESAAARRFRSHAERLLADAMQGTAKWEETGDSFYARFVPDMRTESAQATLAADAISDRAALAGQVMALREALENLTEKLREVHNAPQYQAVWVLNQLHNGSYNGPAYGRELQDSINALAISLPQAAQQVAEWKEKAELLEWLIRERDGANLTAINKYDAVEFVLTVTELYGPWQFEECEWDEEQILNALRAAKEGRAAREASDE